MGNRDVDHGSLARFFERVGRWKEFPGQWRIMNPGFPNVRSKLLPLRCLCRAQTTHGEQYGQRSPHVMADFNDKFMAMSP